MVALSSPDYTYQQSNPVTEKNVYVSCKGDHASLVHESGLIVPGGNGRTSIRGRPFPGLSSMQGGEIIMPIMQQDNSRFPTRVLIHPREYEHQATYRAYLFGPFRLFHGDQPVGELMQRRNKARMILKWFLLNPGKLGSADEFIDLFWPEISPEKALGNFHVTMHYLRHMIEPTLSARQESTFIHRKPNNFYWFQQDESWWMDTKDTEMLFERAHEYDLHGDDSRASYYYRKVANYCSQGFLPEDESEDWLLPYRRRYSHMYSQVLMRLIQLYTQRNELEEVLEYAYQSLTLDPYNEIATRAIVDAHLQQGNVSVAQRRLDAFWSALQHDLGLRPDKEFYILRERIRMATTSAKEMHIHS